jgi:WD40 repeat protein
VLCPCSGSCVQVLTGHSEDVTCVVLTSRGRFAVTGSLDGTAQVWDMQAQDVSSADSHSGKVRLSGCCLFCFTPLYRVTVPCCLLPWSTPVLYCGLGRSCVVSRGSGACR